MKKNICHYDKLLQSYIIITNDSLMFPIFKCVILDRFYKKRLRPNFYNTCPIAMRNFIQNEVTV